MTQPIVAQAEPVAPQRGLHAAAPVVSADDDVADLQDIHRKLHDRQTVQVGVHDQIGDVPVDEQFARQQSDDFIGGHATVRAANPEITGRLLPGKLEKEVRVLPPNAFGPGFVLLEKMTEGSHQGAQTPLSGNKITWGWKRRAEITNAVASFQHSDVSLVVANPSQSRR